MASIENSLKYESEVEAGKIRLVTSGEFMRAYNRSAWLFYCCISKYKVIRKYSKQQQKDVYFLGFPVSKLLELANGRVCTKTDFGYDVTLKPEELPAEDGYEAWTKEVQIYFRLLSDMHQLGAKKAAFFMDKVQSIGKQLAAWHKSAIKGADFNAEAQRRREKGNALNGAEPTPHAGGRPECAGSRPGAASHMVNPICGRAALVAAGPVAKGGLAGPAEATS